jgi:hypothetical protein
MAKSNFQMIFAAMVATLVFAFVTWWVIDRAGGTALDPAYSNTPNATVPGPPGIHQDAQDRTRDQLGRGGGEENGPTEER